MVVKSVTQSISEKGFWSCMCGKIERTFFDESLDLFCPTCKTKVVKKDFQKKLTDPYEVVEEKISVNTGKRYLWKKIFGGKSLTDRITEIRKKNFSAEQTYQILFAELKTKGFDDTKMFDCLRTSVGSRFAEQLALEKRLKK